MKKLLIGGHILFLGFILLSALHYFDIGQWKTEVRWFGIAEILLVSLSLVLFAIKKTRAKTVKWVYALLGIVQCIPMVGAFILSKGYLIYGFFHLVMILWCVSALFILSRHKIGMLQNKHFS